MHIGVDIDGVLRDFVGAVTKLYHDKTDEWPQHITEYYFYKFFPNIPKLDFMDMIFRTNVDEIFIKANPFLDGLAMIDRFIREGHFIHIVTSPPSRFGTYKNDFKLIQPVCYYTAQWLYNNNVKYDSLHFIQDKYKLSWLDVMIDDCPEKLNAFNQSKTRCICIPRSYNTNFKQERLSPEEIKI